MKTRSQPQHRRGPLVACSLALSLLLVGYGAYRGATRSDAWAQGPAAGQPSGDESSLEKKIAAVLPTREEDRWLEIDWHTNIAEARREAERQGKPVLLWVMNGNPLGCG